MGKPKDDFGWGSDHVGKLVALRAAIQVLARGNKVRDRFDCATSCVVSYWDVPKRLRPALQRIRDARRRCRRDVSPTYAYFAFDELGAPPLSRLFKNASEASAKRHSGPVLLVIDQFEEFLILNDPKDRAEFTAALIDLTKNPVEGFRLLIVFRSDYQPRNSMSMVE
jgi:hypothetical protein